MIIEYARKSLEGITIKLRGKTPSVNHLYGFRGCRKFLKKEGVIIREAILKEILDAKIDTSLYRGKKLILRVEVHENWLTKEGKVARKDVANREKFMTDSVFKALGLDDKYIFDHRMIKVQNCIFEYSIIKISLL